MYANLADKKTDTKNTSYFDFNTIHKQIGIKESEVKCTIFYQKIYNIATLDTNIKFIALNINTLIFYFHPQYKKSLPLNQPLFSNSNNYSKSMNGIYQ